MYNQNVDTVQQRHERAKLRREAASLVVSYGINVKKDEKT